MVSMNDEMALVINQGFIYRHIETRDFSYRFRWYSNSNALWNNRFRASDGR